MFKEQRESFKKKLNDTANELVQGSKIIIATCNSSGMKRIRNLNIAHVIIDEATQGMEPESLIPLG